MITATECANPLSTVAFGSSLLRKHSNQFLICAGLLSELNGNGP